MEDFEAQFALNLRTAYLDDPGRAPAARRRGRRGDRLRRLARGGSTRSRGAAGYCASKAALHALAEVVAREHRDDGIRCNVVVPGHDRHAGEPRGAG